MRLSTQLSYAGGFKQAVDQVVDLERAGLDMVWVAEAYTFYNDLVKRYGYEAEAEAIQDLYLDGKKDEAAALVPDDLLEASTLCGSEGYVRERLAAYKESGVTVLNITPVGPDPVKLIEQVKGWIEDL